MKLRFALILIVALVTISGGSANAYLFTMDFTNSTLDLGAASQIDLTNQYDAFGLGFEEVYRYSDSRDPWDDLQYGISNGSLANNDIPGLIGTVYFNELTNYVGFDWWTINSNDFYVHAYATDGTWLGGGFFGTTQGQNSISASGIASIQFHNDGGFTAISTLSYERGAAIPEPATMLLVGLGLTGLGIIRRKRN